MLFAARVRELLDDLLCSLDRRLGLVKELGHDTDRVKGLFVSELTFGFVGLVKYETQHAKQISSKNALVGSLVESIMYSGVFRNN